MSIHTQGLLNVNTYTGFAECHVHNTGFVVQRSEHINSQMSILVVDQFVNATINLFVYYSLLHMKIFVAADR